MPSLDRNGIWGEPTSTLDWCEENYVVTPYIAEFWNTVSNIVMIVPPLLCGLHYRRIGMELRYVYLNMALLVVGVGSWLFHMTLKYEMQLLDELPMIYGTALLIYTLHHTTSNSKYSSNSDIVIPVSYCLTASVVYVTMRNPILHQTFYGLLVFLLIGKSVQTCNQQPRIIPYAAISFCLYLIGFILWNVDNICCNSVRLMRYNVDPGYEPVTQLHAWWHLFSGAATSLQIVFCAYARALHCKKKCSVEMWYYCWPYLRMREGL
ncbi:alkaline ceramidase 3-like [Styela clava]